ncbi:MAG: insulinase family protein [Bacteroidales bacterium]|nr:insulinase family protein [Bacteroidales bacterium]
MKTLKLIALLFVLSVLFSCTAEKYKVKTSTDKNGYKYETVTNDPLKARLYTLDNGLKVFLTKNQDEPRIATLIAVRAGSTSDPVETTGLAHYFEHMMFKGTDKIGTLDWEKEKVLLEEISDLFEQYRKIDNPQEKKAVYRKIDSVSALAAKHVAANEYDKLVSTLGAKRTNAGTALEMTIYINDIPSNELEKWINLESERFNNIVLRLFHTELETVYEEYNMYQDYDWSRANIALMKGLFPKHPYGCQVIGLAEHIKNPSMVNIHNFADTYYVPNNMAIALAGDLDFEKTIQLIDNYFGKLEPNNDLPEIIQPVEDPITEPIVEEVIGPDAESLALAFRFDGDNSEEHKYVTLIDMILSNRQAGLIDLNLNQQQKVLSAGCSPYFLRDYGIHEFNGKPREGQSLEEVKNLLLEEIEKVKKGEFDDWMLEAVINDLRLSEIRQQEHNFSRSFAYIDAFIKKVDYADHLKFIDDLEKITKEQIIEFAKQHYNDNYVVVYKRTGENENLVKVDKPEITPVPINREDQSDFYKEFTKAKTESLKPVFIDFKKEIATSDLKSGIEIYYIKNKTNELFNLQYILDMGKNNNIRLPLAVNYLPYLGTDKYTPAELQKEFFKLGLTMNVHAGNDRCYIYITGLQKSFDKGVELLEHVLSNVKPDQKAYNDYIDGILKKRSDAKLNKSTIMWRGLFNYGKYGKHSSFTNILSEEELKNINPEELTNILKDIYSYKHKLFYYGNSELVKVKPVIDKYHKIPAELKDYPVPVKYIEQPTDQNIIYFVNYDMVQTNILMLAKDQLFDKKLIPDSRLFGEYFGSGLSSIVFQEIRESRALAYSAFASFSVPRKTDESHYTYAFVGTQADKLKIATDAMLVLMNNMPKAKKQFDLAKESIIKKIETERIIKTNIFWTYQRNLERGIDYDIRKDVYEKMKTIDMDKFSNKFFDKHIKGKNYTFLVLGNKNLLDMNVLGKLGTIKELTLEEIFNY